VAPSSEVAPARRIARKHWGSELGGAWRRGSSRQAIAAKIVTSWSMSAWWCGLSHRAMIVEFGVLRRLAPSGTCSPPGGLEAGSA